MTEHASETFARASRGDARNNRGIQDEHILLALLPQDESIAVRALRAMKIDPEDLQEEVESRVRERYPVAGEEESCIPQLIQRAERYERVPGPGAFHTGYLLLALIRAGRGIARTALLACGATESRALAVVAGLSAEIREK